MNKEEILHRLNTDPDFIWIKRFDYSLEKLLERYPNGCPDRVIVQALCLSYGDFNLLEQSVLDKLKAEML